MNSLRARARLRIAVLSIVVGAAQSSIPAGLRAEGLEGRTVLFRAETWDNRDQPYLVSSDYVGQVGEGPEFGLVREVMNDLGVVPVLIDFSARRLDISYPGIEPTELFEAEFNGYVLTFPTECVLILGASVDPETTTLPMDNSALILTPQSLAINFRGHDIGPDTRVGVVIDLGDCPIS